MKFEINGVSPRIDGEYELPRFTARELHEIKLASGVRPLELPDALATGDAACAAIIATLVCRRAGKPQATFDVFMDADKATFRLLTDDEEEGEGADPTQAATKSGDSGNGSKKRSASPEETPERSGGQT